MKSKPPTPTTPPKHITIGWREYADFPDWHVRGIVVKADTGARTGAIDVAEIEELPGDRVRFAIRVTRKTGKISRHIEADISRRSRVRSAFGHARDRLFVHTTIKLGEVVKTVELGLVSRKKMLCRVLLGRKALESHFLIDSGRRYVLGRKPRQAKKLKEADVKREIDLGGITVDATTGREVSDRLKPLSKDGAVKKVKKELKQ